MNLYEAEIGKKVKVVEIKTDERCKKRFSDLGLCVGAEVTVVRYAPFSDPIEICLMGFYLGVRRVDAEKIFVKSL